LAGVCAENEWDAEVSKPHCQSMAACSAFVVVQDRRRYLQLIRRANRILARSWREDACACTVKRPAQVVLGIGVALDHKDREADERGMFQEGSLARGSALEAKAPFTKDGC
jgi:hypothetical protein